MTENTHAGRLIVLTGPTAVGKGTVEAKLRADQKQRRNPPPAVGGKAVVYSPYSLAMTDQRSAAA